MVQNNRGACLASYTVWELSVCACVCATLGMRSQQQPPPPSPGRGMRGGQREGKAMFGLEEEVRLGDCRRVTFLLFASVLHPPRVRDDTAPRSSPAPLTPPFSPFPLPRAHFFPLPPVFRLYTCRHTHPTPHHTTPSLPPQLLMLMLCCCCCCCASGQRAQSRASRPRSCRWELSPSATRMCTKPISCCILG